MSLFWRAIADLVAPRYCPVCGKTLILRENFICTECLGDLPYTYFWAEGHNDMADKFNSRLEEAACSPLEPYCYATALFFYKTDSDYKNITPHIKYLGGLDSGRFFGRLLGARMRYAQHWSDVDMIIPVPIHRKRRWERGYNQTEVISEGLSRELGAPVRADILRRISYSTSQTHVDVGNKLENVMGAFEAVYKSSIMPNHILLVDDVFTTGATSCACHAALRLVFPPAVRISAATLAYVGYR